MSDRGPMTPERWERTGAYVRELFAREEGSLAGVMERARAAGMPSIDAGAESGRVLQLLAMMTGARLAVEVGTLAGYSAVWIARGLAAGGRLITIEASAKHAEVARGELRAAGVADRVTVRQGKGLEAMPSLAAEVGEGSVDLMFLDAERSEYPALKEWAHRLLRPRGVLVVDNALAAQRWTADPVPAGEARDVMDEFNRAMAEDARFAATLLPVGNGLLVAVRR